MFLAGSLVKQNFLYLPAIDCSSDGGTEQSLEIKWLISTAFYVLFRIIIFIIIVTIVAVQAGTGGLVSLHQQVFYSTERDIQNSLR
jgi:hypothetical protein